MITYSLQFVRVPFVVKLALSFAFLAAILNAEAPCRVHSLKIGTARDMVLANLGKLDCTVKTDAPDEDGLEDDLILTKDDEDYAYHEVIFSRGKLSAVWSYSPWFTSAESLFTRLYRELAAHSLPTTSVKAKDLLGLRKVESQVFLQHPIVGTADRIEFDVEGGSIFVSSKPENGRGTEIRLEIVRNR